MCGKLEATEESFPINPILFSLNKNIQHNTIYFEKFTICNSMESDIDLNFGEEETKHRTLPSTKFMKILVRHILENLLFI